MGCPHRENRWGTGGKFFDIHLKVKKKIRQQRGSSKFIKHKKNAEKQEGALDL